MILPGSASRSVSSASAWCAARKRSTPRASDGSIHSVSSATISESRPNGVQNHGTPAYGIGPCAVGTVSIARSAAERRIHAFIAGLAVESGAARSRSRASSRCTAYKPGRLRVSPSRSAHEIRTAISTRSPGSSSAIRSTESALVRSGAGSNASAVVRTTPSRPA